MTEPRPEHRWTADGKDYKQIIGEKAVWVRVGMTWREVKQPVLQTLREMVEEDSNPKEASCSDERLK